MIRERELDLDKGSISPLIFGYFFISMVTIFIIANTAFLYIERRELTNTLEGSLFIASQQLDEISYYFSNPVEEFLGSIQRSPSTLYSTSLRQVPIDCPKAHSVLREQLVFSGQDIEIAEFNCDGRSVSAKIRERVFLPFALKVLGITSFTNQVSARVSTRYSRND